VRAIFNVVDPGANWIFDEHGSRVRADKVKADVGRTEVEASRAQALRVAAMIVDIITDGDGMRLKQDAKRTQTTDEGGIRR